MNVDLPKRQEKEAQNLAKLTGWKIEGIRRGSPPPAAPPPKKEPAWWETIWGGF